MTRSYAFEPLDERQHDDDEDDDAEHYEKVSHGPDLAGAFSEPDLNRPSAALNNF